MVVKPRAGPISAQAPTSISGSQPKHPHPTSRVSSMVLLKAFRAGGLAVNAARRAAGAAWRHMRHRHGTADARMRERRAVTAAACTAGAVLMARRCFGAAAGRCMRALAQRLWMVNVGLNIWALNWTVRFWWVPHAAINLRMQPMRGHERGMRCVEVAGPAAAHACVHMSPCEPMRTHARASLCGRLQLANPLSHCAGGRRTPSCCAARCRPAAATPHARSGW